ncbi:hypothetical protein OC861_006423 [Tilletia horrida]|nr:hypothetical protein OC861_006423 [Tilletia horrida]
MAAVRQKRVPVVERILEVLKQRLRFSGQGQRTQSHISSTPRSSNAAFFLTRKQSCSGPDTAEKAGGDELTQDGMLNRYQAYRACIILFQLHRSIRPARTSQHDSSDRISALILRFSQHLQQRIQASSEPKTIEPTAEVAIQTAEKLSGYIAGAGDDFMSRYAAIWSSIRELEMSAMDPKADLTKLLAQICIDETGDELTIGQTTSMDLRDPLQLELRKWPQAHTFLMHGLARRGLLSGADAVFRALLRRSHSTSPEFENIQLDNSLLSERWAAVRMTANQLARSGQPNHRIVHFVTKRANEILALIGAKPAVVKKQEEPRASEIPPSKFYNAEASVKVSPSSRLLHSLIVGVTEWTVKPEKAVKMYFQFRKRWPLLCCDTGVLKSYLAAVNELELGPSTDLSRLDDPLLTALAEFKGHLFAQHPELANLKSPSWRPPHKRTRADSDKIPAARPLPSELGPFRPAMNFDAPTIVTYARSIWRLIRLRLAQYPSVTRDVYLLIDELLLSLVWMKHLGLRPERSALIQTVIPIRYVYLLKGWHWPDGVQWSERTSSSGVVYKTCDGMGPLSAWLAEWIQSPLPIKAEVARVYDRWWQLMYETLDAPRHGQPKLTQKQMERWQAYAAKPVREAKGDL